jgi:hypothetical protein
MSSVQISKQSRDELTKQIIADLIARGRYTYGILRSQQIIASRSTPDVDSNYYYRQYLIACGKLDKTRYALKQIKRELGSGRGNQRQRKDGCWQIADRALKETE